VLSAPAILAAPAAEPNTDAATSDSKVKKRSWILNCTQGRTNWCRNNHGTRCSGSWPLTNNAWCSNNCDCEWDYSCPSLGGCKLTVEEAEAAKAEEIAEMAAKAAEVPPTAEA
jgi:hypothetical protein